MLTFNPEPFQWLPALLVWGVIFAVFLVVTFAAGVSIGLLTGGRAGMKRAVAGLAGGVADLVRISPGRVGAIAQLTFREAIRRKALLVFVVFALLFMFAGWFLTGGQQRPNEQVRVLVAFVLTTISYLILPVSLLLACWGIPEDIRRRSLHTVVTKPVRRSEIVIGRMLGYTGINTLVLIVMSLVGYFWVERQVPESAQGALVSRVPIFGQLEYLDAEGKPSPGKNVGDIWMHRSYIQGATREKAVYVFDDVTPDVMTRVPETDASGKSTEGEYLRLESTFEAFRTYKGNMDRGIDFQYSFANPDDPDGTRIRDETISSIREFQTNIRDIPRKVRGSRENEAGESEYVTVDLFDDLVSKDGRLQVEVSALDGGQYLGMAPADLFVRTPDRPFASGFFKAVFGIWLMTVLVVVLGVTASTFVKGPVATILTATLVIIGSPFRGFMDKLADSYLAAIGSGGAVEGGGPIESIIRIVRHMNPTTELPQGTLTTIVEAVDKVFLGGVLVVRYLIPDFGTYGLSEYVANGFDIGWSTGLLPAIAVTVAFLIPCLLIGNYGLRFRELEVK